MTPKKLCWNGYKLKEVLEKALSDPKSFFRKKQKQKLLHHTVSEEWGRPWQAFIVAYLGDELVEGDGDSKRSPAKPPETAEAKGWI